MFVTIMVLIIIMFGGALLLLSPPAATRKKSWVYFLAKGKEAGFDLREIEMLHRLAVEQHFPDPGSLFWSQSQLDACIKKVVHAIRFGGKNNLATHTFLSKLYDYQKKIILQNPQNDNSISDSRRIDEGQSVRIVVPAHGVHFSKVVKNTPHYMVITRPESPKLPTGFSWSGTKLSLYFWRDGDAGYVFDSEVEDEVFSRGSASLKIAHGEDLLRTQKRRSVRLKVHKQAFLYLLDSAQPSATIEQRPGIRCLIKDISDTGCAVLVGGKGLTGLRIKVQFVLGRKPICFSGTVRSTRYLEEDKKTILHTEADLMAVETRNHIMGEVFGIFADGDESFSFGIPDTESREDASALTDSAIE